MINFLFTSWRFLADVLPVLILLVAVLIFFFAVWLSPSGKHLDKD